MTRQQKEWFDFGYQYNHDGEHPESICQEQWMIYVYDQYHAYDGWFTCLVENFSYFKRGATKKYNEKNK